MQELQQDNEQMAQMLMTSKHDRDELQGSAAAMHDKLGGVTSCRPTPL